MKRMACLLMCAMLGASLGIKGQSDSIAPGDWSTFNRTLAGDRFSPLSEINRENVTRLRPVCTYTLPEVVALETGPLVIDGTLYFTTDLGSYAIDADTCAEKWRRVREVAKPNGYGAHRGFGYLDCTLFRGTSDAHVIALDAKDGRTVRCGGSSRHRGRSTPRSRQPLAACSSRPISAGASTPSMPAAAMCSGSTSRGK